jgi:hypothetical protein
MVSNLPNLILKVGMQIHTLQRISWCLGNFEITIDKIMFWVELVTCKTKWNRSWISRSRAVVSILKNKTLTWHLMHPWFMWFCIDKNYIHDMPKVKQCWHSLFVQNNPQYVQNWKDLQNCTVNGVYNKTVGDYPYKQYSVIQGGDGGMEYAMCTYLVRKVGCNSSLK